MDLSKGPSTTPLREDPTWLQSQAPVPAPAQAPIPTPVARKDGYGLRIAVLILGAGVTAYIVFQIQMMFSFPYALRFKEDLSSVAGEAGIVVLLFLMAMAAVWGLPLIAAGIFVIAGAIAFHVGSTSFYGDMSVWGGVALILAALSAVDWARRRGFSLNRYPVARRATKLVLRVGRIAIAVILGMALVALLFRIVGFS